MVVERVTTSPTPDERGQSLSAFVAVVLAALIMITGLVVDGGQKATAVSRAESAAAGAARAAGNAVAGQQVAGRSDVGAARLAAQNYLAGTPGVSGEVAVTAGVVTVTTRTSAPTIFLSAIGIDQVSGSGSAAVDVVAVGGG
jgi:hypothetical protein